MRELQVRRLAFAVIVVAVVLGAGCATTTYYYPFQVTSEPERAHVTDVGDGESMGETPTSVWYHSVVVDPMWGTVPGQCRWKEFLIEKQGYKSQRRKLQTCHVTDKNQALSDPAHLHVVLEPLVPVAMQQQQQQQQQQTVLFPGQEKEKVGTVTVTSTPASCELYVDGVFAGNTPASLKLKDGIHIIEVKKAGFSSQRRELRVFGNSDLNLRFELTPKGR